MVLYRSVLTGRREVVAAARHGVTKHAVHHAGPHAEVYHGFVIAVIDAGEFGLLALLFHHLHLVYKLGGDVLGRKLGVIQEEGFSADCDFGYGFSVGGDGTVFIHLNSGKLLQEVLKDVVV